MEITVHSVVLSLKGHDKGGVFAVLGIDNAGYALIADGKRRKTEKLKRKKLKHLEAIGRLDLPNPGVISNRLLRIALRKYGSFEKQRLPKEGI